MADLERSQQLGISPTRVCLLRATWRDRTDRAAAERDRSDGLSHQPRDAADYLARGSAWRKLADAEQDKSQKKKKAEKALADFDRALELNGGKNLDTQLQLAQRYYCQKHDKAGYEKALREVLDAPYPLPEPRLANTVAKRFARRYLGNKLWQEECGFAGR